MYRARSFPFFVTHATGFYWVCLRATRPLTPPLCVSPSAMAGPKPVVLTGPSGAGKSTLLKKLMKEFDNVFGFSVSRKCAISCQSGLSAAEKVEALRRGAACGFKVASSKNLKNKTLPNSNHFLDIFYLSISIFFFYLLF